jgi:transposase InsO family protein
MLTGWKEQFQTSERRVCGLMSIAVSSFRYCSRRSDEDLKEKLVRLAREKPRYGYRRLQVLMEREGERVNHKRLYRVYREAGLCLKRKKRKLADRHSKSLVGKIIASWGKSDKPQSWYREVYSKPLWSSATH